MEEIFQMFEKNIINQSGLLSLKPKLYVCNVDEKSIKSGNKYTEEFINKFGNEGTIVININSQNDAPITIINIPDQQINEDYNGNIINLNSSLFVILHF